MSSIEKANLLKMELDALRPLDKEAEARVMQKFRLEWNYHSNNLEGNSLTFGETKALIQSGITAQGKPLRDHFEIIGHNEAIDWVMEVVKGDRPLTEHFIRELHELLLKEEYEIDAISPEGHSTKKKIRIGEYKSSPNHVITSTGEILRFASPEETPGLMKDLLEWYQERLEKKDRHPILMATQFHYRFVRIHPFDDGNGRTARILMNFILMQFGFPPAIIKTEEKQDYLSVLSQADAGVMEPFVEFIAENLVSSLEVMLKAAKGENIEDLDDIEKELFLLENRLNSISNKVEVFKSKEVILALYDASILKLYERFTSKCALFHTFYARSGFKLFINHTSYNPVPGISIRAFAEGRTRIEEKEMEAIELVYDFEAFSRSGFPEHNHTSKISIELNNTHYRVISAAGAHVRKLYTEALEEEEMTALVLSETKRHTKTINTWISEFEGPD